MKRYKRYKKNSNYSYTLGVFPTLELLTQLSDQVLVIYIRANTEKNKGVSKIKGICKERKISCEVNDKVINRLTDKENVYAVGIFNKYESKIEKDENHLVLVNPSNMGNVGTIIRTALGFKVRNIAIIRPSVDVFHPEVIRSSMGAVFKVNIEYLDTFDEYSSEFNNNIYTFMTNGSELLQEITFKPPFSLVFGSEGEGLADNFKSIGKSVRIPQTDEIDSFNLAVSVGIALFQAKS